MLHGVDGSYSLIRLYMRSAWVCVVSVCCGVGVMCVRCACMCACVCGVCVVSVWVLCGVRQVWLGSGQGVGVGCVFCVCMALVCV